MSQIIIGDALQSLKTLPDKSIQMCVTSPPYFGLRDYKVEGQIGNEPTPKEYINCLVSTFGEVFRVLRDDGTFWLNVGDSYNAYNGNRGKSKSINKTLNGELQKLPKGSGLTVKTIRNKELIGIPWMLAFALREFGWYLRQEIVWAKPNPMPESVKDRFVRSHEKLFLLTKKPRYYFDYQAVQEPAVYAGQNRGGSTNRYEQNEAGMDKKVYDVRNKRDVWTIQPAKVKLKGVKHHACFPEKLVEPCILAGSRPGDTILDPFFGSGTSGLVAVKLGRHFIGIELNPDYAESSEERIKEKFPEHNIVRQFGATND